MGSDERGGRAKVVRGGLEREAGGHRQRAPRAGRAAAFSRADSQNQGRLIQAMPGFLTRSRGSGQSARYSILHNLSYRTL